MSNVKGIIIAAGYGTRFLPGTKTIPKEMFPLIDTPAIQFILDEFIEAGIKDILIVTSRRKKCLEDYFDREVELESVFTKENQVDKVSKIKPSDVNVFFMRQQNMLGTGHAIMNCRSFIGDSSFVVAYPDDLVFDKPSLTSQMLEVHNATNGNVLAVQQIEGDVSRYGVVGYTQKGSNMQVTKIVEKPAKGTEPSKMISVGRYIFTSQIFDLLDQDYKRHQKECPTKEFYHINSINALADEGKVFACKFKGDRIDVGDKIGYLEGIIKYALMRDDLKEEAQAIINKYKS